MHPPPTNNLFVEQIQQGVERKSTFCEPWSVSSFDRFEVRPNQLAWAIDCFFFGRGLMILLGFNDLAFQLIFLGGGNDPTRV